MQKRLGSSDEEIKSILEADLAVNQYFVTGKLSTEIFSDDCRFIDPTNDIVGLSRYLTALTLLFDPASSSVQLKRIAVVGPRRIEAVFVLGGYLKFPWKPFVKPFEGTVTYALNEDGLVETQSQTWTVSALDALLETFTPTMGEQRV